MPRMLWIGIFTICTHSSSQVSFYPAMDIIEGIENPIAPIKAQASPSFLPIVLLFILFNVFNVMILIYQRIMSFCRYILTKTNH